MSFEKKESALFAKSFFFFQEQIPYTKNCILLERKFQVQGRFFIICYTESFKKLGKLKQFFTKRIIIIITFSLYSYTGKLPQRVHTLQLYRGLSSGQTLGVKAQRFRGHTSPHRNVKENTEYCERFFLRELLYRKEQFKNEF
eukprot:TRINITY_DN2076_c0_g2_i1.p7 TRINITY_DN2076_c0_g2~~TRINITY_DN2076_c0_g2_i1.p7  ORF type:complete len:142 (-),score=6.45 TRINITY_DN2076_c0_g2_i1:372-797(-)